MVEVSLQKLGKKYAHDLDVPQKIYEMLSKFGVSV